MSARDICEEMNVDAVLQQKRLRFTKRHFLYEASDEPLRDALKKLEVTFSMLLLML
ncbi:Zinc finger MYMtype protein 1like [Caligus rogercresseyi]|uniref:Zinc finger MYMtype protein 1like n=1 Tax=Caligus rogercresseyi TaxID=217165 RepID=A0A7T8HHU9_CALRO|nr:Zinc finger MYMtype protein 1like [Caligus rogercresseyi]